MKRERPRRRGSLAPGHRRRRRGKPRGPLPAALRALVEDSDQGMILADAQGLITYANPAAERFLGHPPAALVGRLGFELCRDEDLAAARDAFGRCLARAGQPVQVTVGVSHPDAGLRTLAVTLVNRLSLPGVGAVVVYFRDAEPAGTEAQRLQLEAQLRQAQKMEAVGRMTGGIAHDFNNLLSVILANAELIASGLGPDAGVAREDLAELSAAAQRGAAMIRKLLGFSRRVDLNLVPTDLSDLVVRLQGMVRHVVPEHISLEVGTAQQCTALCDAGAVEQMVLNLATNARDAMPEGGTVRIAVSPAVVDRDAARPPWLTPGEFVRLSVADTGVGMDEHTRARALDPFFTTKPSGVGTGLGLSMVYGLVKQQHGFIDLVSEPGKGTTVHLYFPKAEGSPQPRIAPSGGGARRGSATILMLEDDESLQRAGRRVLEHLGYRVLMARDGAEGLAVFRERQAEIDLVISDMVMPGLTGAQVYQEIQRLRPGVPFLLSSGYQESHGRTLEAPAEVRVVPKPWTIDELARTIREALGAGG